MTSSDCIPIYLSKHTIRKLLVPALIGANVIGFTGYGAALAVSARKFKEIGEHKDDGEKGLFDLDFPLKFRLESPFGDSHKGDEHNFHFD